MKIIVLLLLMSLTLFAKEITSNDVYSQIILIEDEMHSVYKHYGIKHEHDKLAKRAKVDIEVRPRNNWQKTYEIMVKINILRNSYGLPTLEPVKMMPVLHVNPDLVYEQTQRILTEMKIFKFKKGIKQQSLQQITHKDKTQTDVFNALSLLSATFDELNQGGLTPSYVFGANMSVFDDLTLILQFLEIEDNTIPEGKKLDAMPIDTYYLGMKMLQKIKQLQILSGIDIVDFSKLQMSTATPSDVFALTQIIIAELQTIKAYLGIKTITPSTIEYHNKIVPEVTQLMSWNLRKLNLIHSLNQGAQK